MRKSARHIAKVCMKKEGLVQFCKSSKGGTTEVTSQSFGVSMCRIRS